jgi:hypothetical protein
LDPDADDDDVPNWVETAQGTDPFTRRLGRRHA